MCGWERIAGISEVGRGIAGISEVGRGLLEYVGLGEDCWNMWGWERIAGTLFVLSGLYFCTGMNLMCSGVR